MSQDDESVELKMQEFVIHPLVYPTLDSIIRDIHFKTFKEFEGAIVLDQKHNPITSTNEIGKFDTHISIIDKKVLHKLKIDPEVIKSRCSENQKKFIDFDSPRSDSRYNCALQKIKSYMVAKFKSIKIHKQLVVNFTEEFIFRHSTKINTKKLEKLEGQEYEADDNLGDPVELMQQKMKLMLTIDKPHMLRKVKLQHSLPQLPKDIIRDVPNYKSIFHTKKVELDYQKIKKLPKTSLVKACQNRNICRFYPIRIWI